MSDSTPSSKSKQKRSNISSKGLLNLKTLVTQNATSNITAEKKDNTGKKLRKPSNRTILLNCLTKTKSKSSRIVISSKECNEILKRIVIPRKPSNENNEINNIEKNTNRTVLQSNTRVIIPKDEEKPTIVSRGSISSSSLNSINEQHVVISSESELNSNQTDSIMDRIIIDNQSSSTISRPQFQTVPTPTQQSFIPLELLDCCESGKEEGEIISNENDSDYWDSCHTSVKLRETMINISKRLTQTKPIILVDTHCHFDLIFDRLYIKHNNLRKYFDDYKDFYPPGLTFELAIQVFWRPRHLTENNWNNWYSKYLNDKRIYGSCGIHPHWSHLWVETTLNDIERCLRHPKIIAIGEIGLDFGPKNTCNMDQQCRVFEEQLKLAVKWCKPIVIHSRDAYKQTFELMKRYLASYHKIHLHCFVGTIDDVHLFKSYFTNIKFGFTPIITRTTFLHTVIEQMDITDILPETDSPYFTPEELSNLSKYAHPGMVYSVIETIAYIRQLSINDVADQLRQNVYHIYGV